MAYEHVEKFDALLTIAPALSASLIWGKINERIAGINEIQLGDVEKPNFSGKV
jgi:hypothetical protein